MPVINMRLAQPAVLVDINRISSLDFIKAENGSVAIGALTRHASVASSEVLKQSCPMLPYAAQFVADVQVRNRGTFGGSISNADPAAQFPALVYTLGGEITARDSKGSRRIPAAEFFIAALTTALKPSEMVTEVRVPSLQGKIWSFRVVAPRAGDTVLAGVAVACELDTDGNCRWARIGMFGVGPTPLRASMAEEKLLGNRLEEKLIGEIAERAAAETQAGSDVYASASYRRELIRWLVAWNLRQIQGNPQEKKR